MEVLIGAGDVPTRSWWIYFTRPDDGTLIWEGIIEAHHASEESLKRGIQVVQNSIPQEVVQLLVSAGQFNSRWEPVWEQVPLKALTP